MTASPISTHQARTGPTATPHRLHLGDLRMTLLDGGGLWLDGGAMFGIIPKPMWSRLVEVDEANRIPLATTCVLVETGGRRVLIETGVGAASKYEEKERGFFRLSPFGLMDSLCAAGIDPATIDVVVLTHLHFDHAGGGTVADGRGGFLPAFPRAKYIVQRGEWDDAVNHHAVMTGTYRKENLAPLERAGILSLVEGEAEIAPGVSVRPLPGHTRHQQGVVLRGGGVTIVLPADLMPTSAHVGLRYNMAYDLLPYENMQAKGRLLEEAVRNDWRLLLGQDPHEALWRVALDGKGRHRLLPCRD
ncbi:MAG: MBL fold metallo-hydrolase [Planctomycetota bacterium]|nr:MAG: MBL fold metallo-hydrolase [Planctomycetota bacterium]